MRLRPENLTIDNISALSQDIKRELVRFQHLVGGIIWVEDIHEIRSFIAGNVEQAKLALELVPNNRDGYRAHEYHFFAFLNHPTLPVIVGVEFLMRPNEGYEYFSDSDSPYEAVKVYD